MDEGTKVWRSDYNKRWDSHALPLQRRVRNRASDNETRERRWDPFKCGRWDARVPSNILPTSDPDTRGRVRPPCPPAHQRLAPPAHLRTFNMRIYFCHPMSQQIKRSGSGDVPCLCSVVRNNNVQFCPVTQGQRHPWFAGLYSMMMHND